MRSLLYLIMAASISVNAAAANCPTKVPAGLTSTSVGDNLVVDGTNMSIVQVQGQVAAAKVMAQTQAEWVKAGYAVKRNSAAGWEILSALGHRCMVTLQLVERNGSFGYLSSNHAGRGKALTVQSARMPVPANATILSTVASDDDGRLGLTVALSTPESLERLALQLHRQLERANWRAITMQKALQTNTGARSLTMSAQRDRRRIDITAWPDGDSKVVMVVSTPL